MPLKERGVNLRKVDGLIKIKPFNVAVSFPFLDTAIF